MEYKDINVDGPEGVKAALAEHFQPMSEDLFVSYDKDGMPMPGIVYTDMDKLPEGTTFELSTCFLRGSEMSETWFCLHVQPNIENEEVKPWKIALKPDIGTLSLLATAVMSGAFLLFDRRPSAKDGGAAVTFAELADDDIPMVAYMSINGEFVINSLTFADFIEAGIGDGSLKTVSEKCSCPECQKINKISEDFLSQVDEDNLPEA